MHVALLGALLGSDGAQQLAQFNLGHVFDAGCADVMLTGEERTQRFRFVRS